jgi:hypothetical protein
MRAVPLASQGLAKEPGPVDPVGQSCGGSGAADAVGAALADGAGAEADAGGAALAGAVVPGALSSLEQAASNSIIAAAGRSFRIRPIVGRVDRTPQPSALTDTHVRLPVPVLSGAYQLLLSRVTVRF